MFISFYTLLKINSYPQRIRFYTKDVTFLDSAALIFLFLNIFFCGAKPQHLFLLLCKWFDFKTIYR